MAKLVAGYGLIALAQVKQYAQAVCEVLGRGEQNLAVYLLCETAAAETHYGTYRDSTQQKALVIAVFGAKENLSDIELRYE